MKLRFFLLLILNFWLILHASCQNSVQEVIHTFSELPELKNASISFKVVNLESNIVIAHLNEDLSIPSASTAKLFATAAAIELLGGDYKPQTKIYMEGKLDSLGTLNGNIWIKGEGDLSLGSKYFEKNSFENIVLKKWLDTLQKIGIKSIKGSVIADGSAFEYQGVPNGWSWEDMGNYYGAGPSGICIYDNTLRFFFDSGSTSGSKTIFVGTKPKVHGLTFQNFIMAEKVTGDKAFVYGAPYTSERFGTGFIPLNQKSFEVRGSLPDPEFQLACDFTAFLKSSGINISGEAKSIRKNDLFSVKRYTSDFKLLYVNQGAPIKEIAKITNLKSVNMFAEGLVCLIGYHLTGIGSTPQGLKQMEKFFNQKESFDGLFLEDGSGLSRSNGISASHFCSLLKIMAESDNYNVFSSTLPIAGVNGTISSLCKGQPGQGRIMAKSGSMNRIKSYAGYVNSKSGKKLAFAFTVVNFIGSSHSLVEKMEKVLNVMATY